MTGKSKWRVPALACALAAAALLVLVPRGIVVAETAAGDQSAVKGKAAQKEPAGEKVKVSRESSGMRAYVDPSTGRLREPTPEEAESATGELRALLGPSVEDLEVVQLPDGSMMVDLQERFMETTVATVGADGKLSFICLQNAAAAEAVQKGGAARSAEIAAPVVKKEAAKKESSKKAETKPAPIKLEEE